MGAEGGPSPALEMLGRMIRDLRIARQMTGAELGAAAHMSQSRISKVERGVYSIPAWDDIVRIAQALSLSDSERQTLRRQFDIAQLDPNSYLAMTGNRLAAKQAQIEAIEMQSRLIRNYEVSVVPGLLQTPAYAEAVFRALGHEDPWVDVAVDARMRRQRILHAPQKEFRLLMHEEALYAPGTSPELREVYVAQLRHLISKMAEPVHLGVLCAKDGCPPIGGSPFTVFDRRYVSCESVVQELVSTRDVEVRLYEAAFAELWRSARVAANASQVLREALDFHLAE